MGQFVFNSDWLNIFGKLRIGARTQALVLLTGHSQHLDFREVFLPSFLLLLLCTVHPSEILLPKGTAKAIRSLGGMARVWLVCRRVLGLAPL